MKVQVHTTLKEGVLDPQGKAVEAALNNLGFSGINRIRQGKLFDIDLDTDSKEEAEKLTIEICKVLLANMVIEDYSVKVIQDN
ncbi:MAG: phosphoribosylformylglycinamidine synthase [Pelagibacterales bacterium]|nr:phosphoribosylformylglycinamidine synthase [Pelagibacterales bacterium]OUV26186.1 MAG: phosphoribosylformylglycinamidine synthase [Alphaproteobacteria bacterium TMED109]RCL82966.1 MAG: phosphoribosylformylglycinamidine synthase subunit PurS [Alphaproteobacteria bacterium]|tara:strand:- start:639 stop:887 length:249 start_codon:yes stop_codon:yes gene_type:complete